jgi:hypothetical protein
MRVPSIAPPPRRTPLRRDSFPHIDLPLGRPTI